HDALANGPNAYRLRALVSASGHDGRLGSKSGGLRRLPCDCAGHLGPLVRLRKPGSWYVEAVENEIGPITRSNVEQERSRGSGPVRRPLPGQTKSNVVLRKENGIDLMVDLRFVMADPEELGSREARECVVSGGGNAGITPHLLADFVALGGRALIVPEDGRPEHLARCIEEHQAMHLAGKAHGFDIVPINACLGQGRT